MSGKPPEYFGVRRYRQLLFQEVPIELRDFRVPNLAAVKGVRFVFDRGPETHVLIDKTFVIRALKDD